jgi:dethiobiotin synthetase
MKGIFVTGTDTCVGKTLFAAALLLRFGEAGITAAACKPVAAGARRTARGLVNGDAELLASVAPLAQPVDRVNPLVLEPPIAPHIAAAEAGLHLDADELAGACRRAGRGADFLVVEGAGGWRVPLGGGETMAGIASRLGLPVVLVVGMKLGCLNHALLSAEAIARDGLALAGWVANPLGTPMLRLEENIDTLAGLLGPPLARLPVSAAGPERERAAEAAAALPEGLAANLMGSNTPA